MKNITINKEKRTFLKYPDETDRLFLLLKEKDIYEVLMLFEKIIEYKMNTKDIKDEPPVNIMDTLFNLMRDIDNALSWKNEQGKWKKQEEKKKE